MSTTELQQLLINKIQATDDDKVLEEVSRLLELEINDSDPYILNDQQKEAIKEAQHQIRNGQFLTNEESNKEIDEWLNK